MESAFEFVRRWGWALAIAGLVAGVAAVVLFVSPLTIARLDALAVALALVGLLLSTAAYLGGRAHRLGVVALGWNLVGLGLLAATWLRR